MVTEQLQSDVSCIGQIGARLAVDCGRITAVLIERLEETSVDGERCAPARILEVVARATDLTVLVVSRRTLRLWRRWTIVVRHADALRRLEKVAVVAREASRFEVVERALEQAIEFEARFVVRKAELGYFAVRRMYDSVDVGYIQN